MHAHLVYRIASHITEESREEMRKLAQSIAKRMADTLDFSKVTSPIPSEVDDAVNALQEIVMANSTRTMQSLLEDEITNAVNDIAPMPDGRTCNIPGLSEEDTSDDEAKEEPERTSVLG